MKRRDLEKLLQSFGWWEIPGTKHAKWTNGEQVTMVPRHNEINQWTAKAILRFVSKNRSSGVKK